MKLMMIVAQPDIAKFAVKSGVDRIFVDLERNGKQQRQGHRDTWITRHTLDDVVAVRKAIGSASLLVRLNPWYPGSHDEIEAALARGADFLMLPMFRSLEEINSFCRAVNGRVPVIPLVETREALSLLEQVSHVSGVGEIFIGLNDLHISLGMKFMFEPLAQGLLDKAATILHAAGIPFGFGGLARVGEGMLPAEKVIGEHVRLGSTSAILSRTFHRQAPTLEALQMDLDFPAEIRRLREAFSGFSQADASVLEKNRMEVVALVDRIVGRSI